MEHWLFGLIVSQRQLVHLPCRRNGDLGREGVLGTLLSPEGAARLEPTFSRDQPSSNRSALTGGGGDEPGPAPRPYLENCTVDAKQASLWPS